MAMATASFAIGGTLASIYSLKLKSKFPGRLTLSFWSLFAFIPLALAYQKSELLIVLAYILGGISVGPWDAFWPSALQREVPDATLNGVLDGETLPGIANISFPRTESDSLLLLFDAEGIACSTGSACSAGVQEASHVLLAMGLSEKEARSSLRFSLGTSNTDTDIEYLQTCIKRVIDRARAAFRD